MEFSVKSGHPEKQRTACLVLGVYEGRKLTEVAESLDKASNQHISNLLRRGDIEGKLGQSLMLYDVPGCLADRVLLIGCGKTSDLNEKQYKTIIGNMSQLLNDRGAMDAACYLTQLPLKGRDTYFKVRFAVEACGHTNYQFDQFKTKQEEVRRPLKRLTFHVPSRADLPTAERAVTEGEIIASCVENARNLGNMPSNIATPTYLAKHAEEIGELKKVTCKNYCEKELKKMGMNALLAVGKGSTEETHMVTLEYKGGKKGDAPIVLVGKGVTFDTGGLCIKPRTNMDAMKMDMCGSAGMLSTMKAIALLELPINVNMIVVAAENMPDGNSYKPGDVIKTHAGLNIEIKDTDAEGRVALCDGLSHACSYNPALIITAATLTGAIIVGLGHHLSGLFGNHNPLINDLLNAGKTANDEAWHMPLNEDYQRQIDSKIADFANLGVDGAGSVTAAAFLSRFVKKHHWAHLDVAGTAMQSYGASGRPVAQLVQFLMDRCK